MPAGQFLPQASEVLVRYAAAPDEWLALLLVDTVGGDGDVVEVYWVLTPDQNFYSENVGTGNVAVLEVVPRPDDRSIPAGIDPAVVYDWTAFPSQVEFEGFVASAQQHVATERIHFQLDAEGKMAGPVLGRPALGPLGARPKPPGIPSGRPVPLPPVPPASPAGGLDLLRKAVGAGLSGFQREPQAEPAEKPAAVPVGADERLLPIRFDTNGQRHRPFADAVELTRSMVIKDTPVAGPPTFLWVVQFMLQHGGTPTGWHTKWRTLAKLTETDAGVQLHDSACKTIEILMTFDQPQCGASAAAEFQARQVQLVEEKWKDRFLGANPEASMEALLFGGVGNRSMLCICPALTEYIAEEMRKEAAVMKERRKAREERAAAKPK